MSDDEVENMSEEDFSGDEYVEDDDDELEEDNVLEFQDDEPPKQLLKRTRSFDVLPNTEILSQSKALIDDIVQVCGIPTAAAATILLRHFKWNKEKLIEAYMENPEGTYKVAGMSTLDLEKPVSNPNATFSCLICLEELPAANTYALSCGHRYCKDCWKGYLEVMIKEGPRAIYTKCPSPKCKCIVHEDAFKKFVNPDMFQKYTTFMLRSFVEDNLNVKWCPAPGCSNAVRCERQNRKQPVTCGCGFSFCFRCADSEIGDHRPVSCEHLEKWLVKASAESENVKWLMANAKKCPKCSSYIEKNGGCMHMTCKICTYEFCWLCRGPWTEHGSATGGYYQCNKYDASDAKRDDEKALAAKTELETYMFYFHRFDSHRTAGKIADQQRKTCIKREEQILEKFDVRSQDTKFLMEATEQLNNNRRVLQYSYVMGYYLDKTDRKSVV